MNFLKLKIAICILALISTPIITAIICPKNINKEPNNSVKIYDCDSDKVISMDAEEYIIHVVAAEMPAGFETEALKAQAVAARTYLQSRNGCSNHPEADICTSSLHCQAYKSTRQLKEQWGNYFEKNYIKIQNAVLATAGEIIEYDGEPISAVFHSTSSGKTESAEDVWGNDTPYLKSVKSPGDAESPKFTSSKTVSVDEFKKIISENNPDVDFDKEFIGNITATDGGAVDEISVGGVMFKGTKLRELFALNSANFSIDIVGSDVLFNVHGYGHGVGMSQYGANYMAASGSSYKDIIYKYYTGVKIVKL